VSCSKTLATALYMQYGADVWRSVKCGLRKQSLIFGKKYEPHTLSVSKFRVILMLKLAVDITFNFLPYSTILRDQ
jgi:hypothetical protein